MTNYLNTEVPGWGHGSLGGTSFRYPMSPESNQPQLQRSSGSKQTRSVYTDSDKYGKQRKFWSARRGTRRGGADRPKNEDNKRSVGKISLHRRVRRLQVPTSRPQGISKSFGSLQETTGRGHAGGWRRTTNSTTGTKQDEGEAKGRGWRNQRG